MKPKQVANRKLVVVALYRAGGATEKIHTEDIAIMAHQLFPDSFSWVKYRDRIDKDIVRVALVEAARASNGSLVAGRSGRGRGHSKHRGKNPATDGWTLTDSGLRWAMENADLVGCLAAESGPKEHRQQSQRTLGRVRAHTLYQDYLARGFESELPLGEMADLLRCRVDAEHDVLLSRIETIRKAAIDVGDELVVQFMDAMQDRLAG